MMLECWRHKVCSQVFLQNESFQECKAIKCIQILYLKVDAWKTAGEAVLDWESGKLLGILLKVFNCVLKRAHSTNSITNTLQQDPEGQQCTLSPFYSFFKEGRLTNFWASHPYWRLEKYLRTYNCAFCMLRKCHGSFVSKAEGSVSWVFWGTWQTLIPARNEMERVK